MLDVRTPQMARHKSHAQMLLWRFHGLLLAGYVLLSVGITYPLVNHFQTGIVGGPIARADGWQNVWAGWWSFYALRHGLNPFVTQMLYYPNGISLLLQTLNIPNWILTFPAQLVWGPIAAYNASALLGFILSGYITYLFVQRVVQQRVAAALAGACFTAAPFHVAKFYDGQLEHVTLQWLPLFALATFVVIEQLSWRRLALWTVALTLVSYTSWYYTIFCAAYLGVSVFWLGFAERQWRRAGMLTIIFACLGFLIVSPALISVLQSGEDMRPAAHWIDQARESSADLTELFLPSALHPIWGSAIQSIQEGYHPNNTGWLITPGYTVLAVALYGAIRTWRESARWVTLFLALIVLALGDTLHIAGYDTGIPLPYRLLELIPGANLGRRPSHFVALALIPLVVLVGLGLRDIWQRAEHKRVLLVFLFATSVAVEYTPRSKELTSLDVPPAYATLVDGSGAIFDIPANAGALDDLSDTLKHQIVHNRPIIGGYVSRRPDYLLTAAPGIRQLWRLRCSEDGTSDPAEAALGALSYYGVRDVVINTANLSADKNACAQQLLTGWGMAPAQGSDSQVTIYHIPTVPAQSFLFPYEGWYATERSANQAWRWMGQQGTLVLANTTSNRTTLLIKLTLESYRIPRTVRVVVNDTDVARLTVTPGQARTYRLPIESPPGEQVLSFYTDAEPDPAPDTERLISIAMGDAMVEASQATTP